ncbi:MAG TPA: ATPase domain-containing protein [Thermoanaerobaculia bacterium]|jgi:circadian clock protein KaiC
MVDEAIVLSAVEAGGGTPERVPTGVPGLDEILGGGLPRHRMYLVEGDPGAGKTTLAMQFLLEGARRGEPGVYATLSETEDELRAIAESHGWGLDGITICDLQTAEESLKADSQYTLFHPSEIELSETTRTVLAAVEEVEPTRVVFDSLSEIRMLARDSLRYRRQILALKHYFTGRRCTVVLLDHRSAGGDFQLQSLTHGVITLEHLAPEYGGQRRRVRVQKVRGIQFRDGYHDFSIERGGLAVFPRLVAAGRRRSFERESVGSDSPELDALLGGGLTRGTSTMLLGPAGVGKSTLAMQYLQAAGRRGERAQVFVFDEAPETWLARADGLGMELRREVEGGRVELRQVDPAQLSPGEFARLMCDAIDGGAGMVVIDSLNGYMNGMPEERFLSLHLHELLSYANQQGAVTLMIMAQSGIVGTGLDSPVELSYLADTVVLLRYFEVAGEVRQAISVVKKRTGRHEKTVRELRIEPPGLRVGRRLSEFTGVLTGQPVYTGGDPLLLEGRLEGRTARDQKPAAGGG